MGTHTAQEEGKISPKTSQPLHNPALTSNRSIRQLVKKHWAQQQEERTPPDLALTKEQHLRGRITELTGSLHYPQRKVFFGTNNSADRSNFDGIKENKLEAASLTVSRSKALTAKFHRPFDRGNCRFGNCRSDQSPSTSGTQAARSTGAPQVGSQLQVRFKWHTSQRASN